MPAALVARMSRLGAKRMLSLDGGGIRGMISLGVLARMEAELRALLQAGPDFVLSDWFDSIAGTSTGAIIAAGLSLGMSVAAVRAFYIEQGAAMFGRARMVHRLRYRFESEKLAEALRAAFGATRTLGSADLRTLLMVTLYNVTTDSPWPLSNNPFARYNDRSLLDCNLDLPLWQVVRASTAAPTFFPPEMVQLGATQFVFADGGVTPYNNPAFLQFLMSTSTPYRVGWATGADRLLLVSVGTGSAPQDRPQLQLKRMNLLFFAAAVPQALIFAGVNHQDLACRMLGRTLFAPRLDGEVGDLTAASGGSGLEPMFSYVRYNADLTRAGLDGLGLGGVAVQHVRRMDGVGYMDELDEVGRAVAEAQVRAAHFHDFAGSGLAGS